MSQKPKIALFVGEDVTAQIVMNRVIDDMITADEYEPIIFLPKHGSSKKADLPELKRFAFYDRHLLNQTVYPFIEENRIHAPNRSPRIIGKDQGIAVEKVDDVNSANFIERISNEPDLVGAVSIRCFQIFKQPIIEAMDKKGFFLNLHPGILPQYRGVMSTFRTIAADEHQHGWTLHKVDKGIDTGEILWVKAKPLDLNKSGYSLNIDIASIGAQSIRRALEEINEGNILKGYPQNSDDAKYYTYPTKAEIRTWEKKGIKLADADEVTSVLVEKFSQAGTVHAKELTSQIRRAVRLWEEENNPQQDTSKRPSNDLGRLDFSAPTAALI